jgi:hypothetical protein
LIGQRTDISPFGTTRDGEDGDFSIYADGTVATAPTTTDDFLITADGGNGDSLYLTSFRPAVASVPEPGGLTLLFLGVAVVAVRAACNRYLAAIA